MSTTETTWERIHAARRALADDLSTLDDAAWRTTSLCPDWDVEHVVAHLTAAASTGRWAWIRSIVASGFRPAVHNERRLREHLGATPSETLERFRAVVDARTAPTADLAAYLGEVLVHGEDVRRPLGLPAATDVPAWTEVAEFYVARDFAVPSRTRARGLRLEATDGPFAVGKGPVVSGPTADLVLALAGRPAALDPLDGPGAGTLRDRLGDGT